MPDKACMNECTAQQGESVEPSRQRWVLQLLPTELHRAASLSQPTALSLSIRLFSQASTVDTVLGLEFCSSARSQTNPSTSIKTSRVSSMMMMTGYSID